MKSIKVAATGAMPLTLLLTACSGWDDTFRDEASSGVEIEDAASTINQWEPCETFSANFDDLIEHYQYDSIPGERISAAYGEGTPADLVECTANVMWEKDPDAKLDRTGMMGYTTIALVAAGSPEATAERFDELTQDSMKLFKEADLFEDAEIPGDWNKGRLLHGDYGKGDAFSAYALYDDYLIRVDLETGANLSGGDGGRSDQETFDVEEVQEYLMSTVIPEMNETVESNLDIPVMTTD
ncbi:hypothetical protein [Salininema proteolyticum]|uniref:Lipoprotein n=1 Tax=Salininema proteolyticum TaxID=1607685 RepID=A0ABV8TTH1_9ACTN